MKQEFKDKHSEDILTALAHKKYWVTEDSVSVRDFIDILKEHKCYILDDTFNRNGWQYDFHFYFIFFGDKFVCNGCGYYGGYSIALEEE